MNTDCRVCRGTTLKEVIDFSVVALAGGFLKASQFHVEQRYPLKLMFCPHCFGVQLDAPVKAETLFTDYFYFTGQTHTAREHFKNYAKDVIGRFSPRKVLEIGCNDGYLLGCMADSGAACVGVDPASNVVSSIKDGRIKLVNDFFTEEVAEHLASSLGQFDTILANNVFAHIPDIHGATEAIKVALAPDGVLVLEVHHLGAMIEGLQYDWIYHEHLFYWSALALAMHLNRHGLSIFDVKWVAMHGGSMRYYVCRQGERMASPAVDALLESERKHGLDQFETFEKFSLKVREHRRTMLELIGWVLNNGQTIAGYGASGRANALLQYWGLDASHLTHMVDDAPAKHGVYTPGSHLPIYPRTSPKATKPSYTLVLAWPYADEILPKLSGDAIIPLPEIRFVEPERGAA